MERGGKRSQRDTQARLARQHSPALLLLPRDGWAGDNLRRCVGNRSLPAVAAPVVQRPLDAVDFAVAVPLALHRQHRWLDDGRAGAAAMAGLWFAAHRGWLFQDGVRW